ncbi:hypothetical protein ZIOFF_013022 [Zingiber officinale]|uniref:Uncharacterized protein n=1 Tax=Zingiber officinale TaxID=94328 RepID=A0A8J5LPM8_ZINOF|nr:hypothetical protein ZIOFF_013022 [Zingiber officinale]
MVGAMSHRCGDREIGARARVPVLGRMKLGRLAEEKKGLADGGAMNQLTRCLACEWAKDNIRTNCVVPDVVNTPMAKLFMDNEEQVAKWCHRAPLGRVGEPEEVAASVAFLLPSFFIFHISPVKRLSSMEVKQYAVTIKSRRVYI